MTLVSEAPWVYNFYFLSFWGNIWTDQCERLVNTYLPRELYDLTEGAIAGAWRNHYSARSIFGRKDRVYNCIEFITATF